MGKTLLIFYLVLATAPAYAVFTEDFETNPFGVSGTWSHSGNVALTGGRAGNEFVRLGQSRGNNTSQIWQSFTVPTTGQYSVSFDYQFVGVGRITGIDDKVNVQIGISGESTTFDVFKAASRSDLTGSSRNLGSWHTVNTTMTLEAGKEYWLDFELKGASGRRTRRHITYLNLDNIDIVEAISSNDSINTDPLINGTTGGSVSDTTNTNPAIPAPGAILLGGIGVSIVGWMRRRKTL